VRYVLVPVPTEHVLDVMRWVVFREPGDGDDARKQDEERLAELLADADDGTRAMLGIVATATVKGEPLRLRDLADELGRPSDDVRANLRKLNEETLEGGRPLFQLRDEASVNIHGRTGTLSYVAMRPDLARIARSAKGSGGA
jgi:hypothetical protein